LRGRLLGERPSLAGRGLLVLRLPLDPRLPPVLLAPPASPLLRVDLAVRDLLELGLGALAAGLAGLSVRGLCARPAAAEDAPRAAPRSRLTCRVRSSILRVRRSTSAWLAVRLSLAWTCLRLPSRAFCPRSRLRSICLTSSGGSRFCKSLTALPAACRAWPTRLGSPDLRVDARERWLGM
jgi:hypothetical protein